MLFIYIYYFKEPFELHINVTVQFCVSTATPSTYLFAIALAVALFPDLEALFEEIFQLVFLDDASATDFVHVDEEPVYVNVPVTVNVARATTIASANIPKGTTITADLLEDSFVNESTNTSAVITDKSMILGSKARRDIRAGEQIKVSDFCVIAKGDIVTIVASTNNLEIKTQGQALEEGKVNDLIQVKNVKTKKVIQAVVTGPNTVKVIF